MKIKSITLIELQKNNPTFCLSAKRALNKCYECKSYEKCKSKIINTHYDALCNKKRLENVRHQKRLDNINSKIYNIDK